MASKKEKQYQKDLNNLLNQQFQSGQDYLNQQTTNLQSYQPQYEQSVAQSYEAQVPEVQRQLEQQRVATGQQQEQVKGARESALAEARRQYQEGTQRTQQLFGGVAGSSAGQAQSELLAREQQRQFGQTQTATTQNLGQLSSNFANQEQMASNAIMAINADKQKALTQARDQFRQQLDTINSQRFQLAQDKSNKQIQALQDFNTRRRTLEDFYKQQEASLASYKAQQPIALNTYAQQLKLAQQYAPATGVSIPDLGQYGYNDQARLGAINKILTFSDTDLRKSGYRRDVMPVGNQQQQVIIGSDGSVFDVYTGARLK